MTRYNLFLAESAIKPQSICACICHRHRQTLMNSAKSVVVIRAVLKQLLWFVK